MCGPSGQQKSLESQQSSFSTKLQQNYSQMFSDQAGVLSNLNAMLTPIANGTTNAVSPAETAAETTTALNTTGANFASAARALGGELAGRGSSSGLESGIDQQIKASLASKAAGDLSGEELGITQRDADINRAEKDRAQAGLQGLAMAYNPTGYAGQASSANQSAYGEATQNSEASAQEFSDIAGGIASIGSVAAAPFTGGASLAGAKALSGNPVTPANSGDYAVSG